MDDKQKNEWREEFEIKGNELVTRVKELIAEGNVRRLIIYKSDGDILMEVPLTASVVVGGAMLALAPIWAALGAAAAFLAEVRIEVVRVDDDGESSGKNKIDVD